ncbi:MAG: DUF29 domain-containing protein [Cyanosarcina radialis HA8281-LM2]|nr:DUF29 domain-containing protein [Cyanosarcina radialis HA8281-LM2]
MTLSKPLVSYDRDFNLWIEQTVELLRSGRWAELDLENLIDELEGTSRRDKREILSRLKVLIMHLLKWKYQPDRRCGSWESTIRTNRDEIAQILADSPSLKNYPALVLEQAYPVARKNAASETELHLEIFPADCPFSIETVLEEELTSEQDSN